MSLSARYARALAEAFGDEQLIHEEGDSVVPPAPPVRAARGDALLDAGEDARLPSPLPGVDDDRWAQFVRCMACGGVDEVSPSNGLGLFALSPRRLADLGVVTKLARSKSDAGRTIWVAVFVPPLTSDGFLKSPQVQYRVFSKSVCDYADKIADGSIKKPDDVSLSGALAILQRCGPSGLETWQSGERFASTQAAYDRVAGIF